MQKIQKKDLSYESGSTAARTNADFSLATIDSSDYDYKRNHSFITLVIHLVYHRCYTTTELPHDLDVGDQIIVKKSSTTITFATVNKGYNGTFLVTAVDNDKTFKYSTTDVMVQHIALDSLQMIQVVEQLHFLDLKMIYRQTITSIETIRFKVEKIFLMVCIIFMF